MASHIYIVEKKGLVEYNTNVLLVVRSVSPFTTDINTPSVPDKMVRDRFKSTLYHVMIGLGLAIAAQLNVAKPGSVTLTFLSAMNRVFGGTVRCSYFDYGYNEYFYTDLPCTTSSNSLLSSAGVASLLAKHS